MPMTLEKPGEKCFRIDDGIGLESELAFITDEVFKQTFTLFPEAGFESALENSKEVVFVELEADRIIDQLIMIL